jgi:yersiniabactin nonribosomal peptide/polyketide synthase
MDSGIAEHIPRRRWPLNAQTDYDLRDIEQAAQEYPGIQQARAELSENGALTLDIVMTEDPPPSAPLHDEHDLASLALPLPEQTQLDELEATWRWLEARALQGIAATLHRHRLFTTPEVAHPFGEIVQALGAQASHRRLLRQWLQCLAEREWLVREGIAGAAAFRSAKFPNLTKRARKPTGARRWRSIWTPASPGTTTSSPGSVRRWNCCSTSRCA